MAEKIDSNEKLNSEAENFSETAPEKDDYLADYRAFFEKFANVIDNDELPVKLNGRISITEDELPGEILSYALQYLDLNDCPPGLIAPLCREVLEDVRKACMANPHDFGYTPHNTHPNNTIASGQSATFQSLHFMRGVVSRVLAVLRTKQDNSLLAMMPAPQMCPRSAIATSRNGRRTMEDRHVVIDDFSRLFDIPGSESSSFYAIYDGHCGSLAASFAAVHLHFHFVNSPHFLTNPKAALREAFIQTDKEFGDKKSAGGTTAAVCYLKGNNLLVGWVGDTQALLVGDGSLIQLVNPHRPSRQDENDRITSLGGCCMKYKGLWRVSGVLAVSRAIGNIRFKPYISSEPDFATVKLNGFEEFVVLACDGLWDFVTEDEVALEVYKSIQEHADDLKKVAAWLVQLAKNRSSVDNISVIVIFLQDPQKLADKAAWLLKKFAKMDASFEKTSGAQTNRFLVNEDQDPSFSPKDCGLLFDLAEGYKQQNGGGPAPPDSHHTTDPFFDERPTNGKRTSDHFDDETHDDDDDDDFGPETDVDAVDDVLLSPSIAAARLLVEGVAGKEPEIVAEDTFDVCMKETSTLPIEAVLEISGGLVDNVGESGGEESEDEWNYFKGENKSDPNDAARPDSQTLHTTQEIESKLDAEIEDAMSSPLNPEAAPFVPVSPTPGSGPEGSALPARLLDQVVSQSPQKPQPMDDINIPEASEFESEVCTRLADLGGHGEYLNGHSDNSALSSQENLKETLHGNEKHLAGFGFGDDEPADGGPLAAGDVDEAEFDRVQKDTTDFCDIRVAHATHNERGFEDEGIDEELYERLKNKERDPMSMSFYQEKDEDTCETRLNPFDLNAVQTLPDSDEDFCSDQPQPDNSVNAFGMQPSAPETNSEVTAVQIDAAISDLDDAVTNEIESFDASESNPMTGFGEADTCIFGGPGDSQNPFGANINLQAECIEVDFVPQVLSPVFSPLEAEEALVRASPSPIPATLSPVPNVHDEFFNQSPKSPGLAALSPEPTALSSEPTALSPEPTALSPEPTALSPEPTALSPEPTALSPEPSALSPEPAILSPELAAFSPEPAALTPEPAALSPVPIAMSPEPIAIVESVEVIPEPIDHSNDFAAHSPAMSPEPFRTLSPAPLSPAPFGRSSPFSAPSPLPASPSPAPLAESSGLPVHSPAASPAPVLEERDDCGFFEGKMEESDLCQFSEAPIADLQSGEISSSAAYDEKRDAVDVDFLADSQQQVSEFIEARSTEIVNSVSSEFSPEEICRTVEDEVKMTVDPIANSFGDNFYSSTMSAVDTAPTESVPFDFNNPMMDNFVNEVGSRVDATFEVPELSERISSPVVEAFQPVSSTSPDLVDKIERFSDEISTFKDNIVDAEPTPFVESIQEESVTENIIGIGSVAVAAAAGAAVIAAVATDKKTPAKTKATPPALKKTAPAKTALSPTKPTAPKTAPAVKKTAAAPLKSTTATPPKAAAAPRPRPTALTSPSARPATKTTTAAPAKPRVPAAPKTALADKKPLTNGTEVKREPIKRPVPGSVPAKTAVAPKPATAPAKAASAPARTAPRPATATARPAAAVAPKPAAARPATTTAAAKPRPLPTPATRAPISKTTTTTRAPAADKLTKDTTNKQISASRPTPAPRAGLAPKSTDLKTTSKTTTKTSTTTVAAKSTNPPPIRRPTSATTKTTTTKTTSKTTTTTKLVGGKTVVTEKLNGSLKEEEMCMNGSPLITDITDIPLKDSSPQHVDNSLLPIIDAAAD